MDVVYQAPFFLWPTNILPGSKDTFSVAMAKPEETHHHLFNFLENTDGEQKDGGPVEVHRREDRLDQLHLASIG